MKLIGKLTIWILAAFGLFYVAAMSLVFFLPNSASYSSERGLCERIVLSSQVSPDLSKKAEHIGLSCADGTIEHSLSIRPFDHKAGGSSHSFVFPSNGVGAINYNSAKIYPLTLSWENDEELAVLHQPGLFIRSRELLSVQIKASPYR